MKRDFKYIISYETEGYRPCLEGEYGDDEYSECDPYCRCYTITAVRVQPIDPYQAAALVNELGTNLDELSKALFFMACKHHVNPDDFKAGWSRSYYGDEVDSVYLIDGSETDRFLQRFASLSVVDQLHTALVGEYGFVLNDVQPYKKWKLESIKTSQVQANPKAIETVNGNRVWTYNNMMKHKHNGTFWPASIAVPDGDKYKIVDGFHRYVAYMGKKNRRKIKLIIPDE